MKFIGVEKMHKLLTHNTTYRTSNELILHTKGKLCHRVGNEQNRGQADPMPRNNENGRIKTINIPM